MNEIAVVEAIEKAKDGINKYLEIMNLFYKCDVSQDRYFQRKFKHFYRITHRSHNWYETYFSYMECQKGKCIEFADVLIHLYKHLNRCEPSFSSKFVATMNPNNPIWDKHVLEYFKLKAPSYGTVNRINKSITLYKTLQDKYDNLLKTKEADMMIQAFNKLINDNDQITDLKKVDFVLWQMRG